MDDKVSFSINTVFGAFRAIFEFLTSFFRPVTLWMHEVAGQSWLGFALVFGIGFSLMLVRWGAKSKGVAVYSASLEYIGKRGLLACAVALGLLGVEYAVMPVVTIAVSAIANTLTGGEPGVVHLVGFLFSPSPGRTAFLGDLAQFYDEAHTAFPLGIKAVMLVGVAFGSMLMVGKAAKSVIPPPPTS